MSNYRIYPDELCHHGILGMKWGKRNGPPYPLEANDHSASEKKSGWRKSLNTAVSRQATKKHQRKTDDLTGGSGWAITKEPGRLLAAARRGTPSMAQCVEYLDSCFVKDWYDADYMKETWGITDVFQWAMEDINGLHDY